MSAGLLQLTCFDVSKQDTVLQPYMSVGCPRGFSSGVREVCGVYVVARGMSMDCPRAAHRVSMECPWFVHGAPMGDLKGVRGMWRGIWEVSARFPLAICGLSVGRPVIRVVSVKHPWVVRRWPMERPCLVRESHTGCQWRASGAPMGRFCVAHGMPVGIPWLARENSIECKAQYPCKKNKSSSLGLNR